MRGEPGSSSQRRYFQAVPTAQNPDALLRQVMLILDREREDQGMSQAEMGRRMGIAQSTVSKYLDMRLLLNLSQFDAMCQSLGMNPGEVIVEADRLRSLE